MRCTINLIEHLILLKVIYILNGNTYLNSNYIFFSKIEKKKTILKFVWNHKRS